MPTKFVLFRRLAPTSPSPYHRTTRALPRTVRQSGSAQVTLVMDDGGGEGGVRNVEGDSSPFGRS